MVIAKNTVEIITQGVFIAPKGSGRLNHRKPGLIKYGSNELKQRDGPQNRPGFRVWVVVRKIFSIVGGLHCPV
jgi:hypothetical protein